MKLFYFTLLIVGTNSLFAQSQITEAISSSGGIMNNSSNTIIYNLGETIIDDVSNSEQTIAHGILNQSIVIVLTSINDLVDLKLNVYPNPVVEKLVLSTKEPILGATNIQIWDVNGKMISNESLTHLINQYEIDMSAFKEGAYFLTIQTETKSKNTYRIIKN